MQAELSAKRDASADFRRAYGSGRRQLTINDTGDSRGSEITITATAEQFAEWAKLILGELEPSALSDEARESV